MKRLIFFILMVGVLSAQAETDISFTAGYNKFDDPNFLRSGRMFYGIRGGVYRDDYGFQLGYEQANGANCQGLDLKRVYVNALKMSHQSNGITPYALVTVGHESSNIQEHKPSQAFLGAGVGVKKDFNQNVGGFLEARILRKLESDDIDMITTMGLTYRFDTRTLAYAPVRRVQQIPTINRHIIKTNSAQHSVVVDSSYRHQQQYIVEEPRYIQPQHEHVLYTPHKLYYIQVVALASSAPEPYIEKLYRYGIENVEIREVYKRGRAMSIVAVGPYENVRQVKRALRHVKRVSRGAFIVRF